MKSATRLLRCRGLLGPRCLSSCTRVFRLPRATCTAERTNGMGRWRMHVPIQRRSLFDRSNIVTELAWMIARPFAQKFIDSSKGLVAKLVNSGKPIRANIPVSRLAFTERPTAIAELLKNFWNLRRERGLLSYPVVVFLQDEPGSGKTQLACEFAIRRLHRNPNKTIGWIDATDRVTTIRTLRGIAAQLNEDQLEKMDARQSGRAGDDTREDKLSSLRDLVQRELNIRPGWLLIIDDLTSDSPQDYLPLGSGTGDINWGSGLVLVTTRERLLIRHVNTNAAIVDGCRMTNLEATELLVRRSGVGEDELHGSRTLAQKLEYHPFSLAIAGAYINTARNQQGWSKYGFHEYLHDYETDAGKVTDTGQLASKIRPVEMKFEQFTSISKQYERLFMVLACTKSWKHVIPLSVLARVLEPHSQPLRLPYLHEKTMIDSCTLLRRDNSAQYTNGVTQPTNSFSEVVQDNVESVYLFHRLAHGAAKKHYGLGDKCVDSQLRERMQQTVNDTIVALNNEYVDAIQLESASALTIRRLILPLTEAFLEVADNLKVPVKHLDRALALATLGDALSTFVTPERGRSLLSDAHRLLKEYQGSRHLTTVRVRTLLAIAHRQLGDADASIHELKIALAELDNLQLPENQDSQLLYGGTLLNLGVAYTHLGDYSRAQELFQRGLETFKSLLSQDEEVQKAIDRRIAQCLSKIGMTKRKRFSDDLGESNLDEAVKIQRRLESPDIAFTLGNLAIICRERGSPEDLEESSKYLTEALQIEEKYYGKEHMSVATTKSHLSIIRRRQGRMKDAFRLAEEAHDISKHVHGHMKAFHPGIANCLSAVARTLRDLGQLENAREAFAESLKINEDIYGRDHHKVIAQLAGLASVYRHMGLPKEAEPLLKDALERCKEVQTKEQEARCHRILAHVYEMLDMPREAVHHWNTALSIYNSYEEKLRGVTRTSQVAVCEAHLAYLNKDLNKPHREEGIFDRLLEPYYKHTGEKPHSAEMIHVLYVFGKLKLRTQQHNEAVDIFRRVVRDQREFLGCDHPRLVVSLTAQSAALVGLYKEKKDARLLDDADQCLVEAQAIVDKKLNPDHLLAAEVCSNRGFLLCERNSIALDESLAGKAFDEFDKALAIREKALGRDNRKYAKSLAGKARATYYLEDCDMALTYSRQAREYFEKSRARMLTVTANVVKGTNWRLPLDKELEDLDKLVSNIKDARRVSGYQEFNPPDS